jgi:hypothetical protein
VGFFIRIRGLRIRIVPGAPICRGKLYINPNIYRIEPAVLAGSSLPGADLVQLGADKYKRKGDLQFCLLSLE